MHYAHHIAVVRFHDSAHDGQGVLRAHLALSTDSLRAIAILHLILINLLLSDYTLNQGCKEKPDTRLSPVNIPHRDIPSLEATGP